MSRNNNRVKLLMQGKVSRVPVAYMRNQIRKAADDTISIEIETVLLCS